MLLSVASRIVAANVRAREPLLFRKYDLFRIQNRRRRRTRHSCGADILCRCLADLVRYWIMLRTRCECIRSLSLHSSHSEPCAFLYDSELNIVVLQRSPHVSHAAFARLVNWAADTAFFFLPVLNGGRCCGWWWSMKSTIAARFMSTWECWACQRRRSTA